MQVSGINLYQHILDALGGKGIFQGYSEGKFLPGHDLIRLNHTIGDINHRFRSSHLRSWLRDLIGFPVGNGHINGITAIDRRPGIIVSRYIDCYRIHTVDSLAGQLDGKFNQKQFLFLIAVFGCDSFHFKGLFVIGHYKRRGSS